MFKLIRNIVFKSHKPTPLGRWSLDYGPNKDIKSILANYDNCGDRICKDPVQLKNLIEKEVKHKFNVEKKKE